MMALTASTPILKGRIADTDCRWGVISESVDDRTPSERGRPDPNAPYPELAAKGQRRIYKSRYDSISTYIYQGDVAREANGVNGKKSGMENRVLNMYNDIPVYPLMKRAVGSCATQELIPNMWLICLFEIR